MSAVEDVDLAIKNVAKVVVSKADEDGKAAFGAARNKLYEMNKRPELGGGQGSRNDRIWVFSHVVCVGVPIAVIVARSLPVGPRCGRGLGLTFPFAEDGRAMWALLILAPAGMVTVAVGAAANARHSLQIHDQSERATRGRIEK